MSAAKKDSTTAYRHSTTSPETSHVFTGSKSLVELWDEAADESLKLADHKALCLSVFIGVNMDGWEEAMNAKNLTPEASDKLVRQLADRSECWDYSSLRTYLIRVRLALEARNRKHLVTLLGGRIPYEFCSR